MGASRDGRDHICGGWTLRDRLLLRIRKMSTPMTVPTTLAEARAAAMQAAFEKAARINQWGWIADEFYAQDCRYLCEYGGTMRVFAGSRAEIKATHYGREMLVGWEGWTFPIEGYTT